MYQEEKFVAGCRRNAQCSERDTTVASAICVICIIVSVNQSKKLRCGNIRTEWGKQNIRGGITLAFTSPTFFPAKAAVIFLINRFSHMTDKAKSIRSDSSNDLATRFFSLVLYISCTGKPWRVFSFNTELITPYLIGYHAWVIYVTLLRSTTDDHPRRSKTSSLFNAPIIVLPLARERKRKHRQIRNLEWIVRIKDITSIAIPNPHRLLEVTRKRMSLRCGNYPFNIIYRFYALSQMKGSR